MSTVRRQAEQALAAHAHRRHAVLTGNGTTALWAVLSALELPQGAAVLYPDLTCETAVNAAILAGLRPVFADVQSATAHPAAASDAAAGGSGCGGAIIEGKRGFEHGTLRRDGEHVVMPCNRSGGADGKPLPAHAHKTGR